MMVRSLIVVTSVGLAGFWFSPATQAQCCKGQDTGCGAHRSHGGNTAESTEQPSEAGGTLLTAYFRVWKALGKDELKGVPEAKKDLVSILQAAIKIAPKGLSEKDRAKRAKLLASAQSVASKLDTSDLRKAREGFGALSGDLRKFIDAFPAEADAYVVYCDMAKKSWLQDSPKVLNPYYGSSMSGCGQVVRKPNWGKTFYCPMHTSYRSVKPTKCPTCGMKLVPMSEEKPADPHEDHTDPHADHQGQQH